MSTLQDAINQYADPLHLPKDQTLAAIHQYVTQNNLGLTDSELAGGLAELAAAHPNGDWGTFSNYYGAASDTIANALKDKGVDPNTWLQSAAGQQAQAQAQATARDYFLKTQGIPNASNDTNLTLDHVFSKYGGANSSDWSAPPTNYGIQHTANQFDNATAAAAIDLYNKKYGYNFTENQLATALDQVGQAQNARWNGSNFAPDQSPIGVAQQTIANALANSGRDPAQFWTIPEVAKAEADSRNWSADTDKKMQTQMWNEIQYYDQTHQSQHGGALGSFFDKIGPVGLVGLGLAGGLGAFGAFGAGAAGAGAGAADLTTGQLASLYEASGMSAADAAAAASQAASAGGLVGSGAGAYTGIAGAVDAAGNLGSGIVGTTGEYTAPTAVAGTSDVAAPAVNQVGTAGIVDPVSGVTTYPLSTTAPVVGTELPAAGGLSLTNIMNTPTPPVGTSGGSDQTPATAQLPATTPVANANQGISPENDAMTTAANTAKTAAASSIISRILDGTATAADYTNLAGTLGTTALGVLGSNAQSNTLQNIYNQQRADRAPALAAYNNALSNPDTFYNSAPAMGALDATLRKLSVNGNPATNPGDLSKAAAYNLGGYNSYLSGLSGPAFGGQATQANLGTSIAGADNSLYNSLAGGIGNLTAQNNNSSTLTNLLKQFGAIV